MSKVKEKETDIIEFTLQELLDLKVSLESLLKREDINVLVSYRISKIAKRIFDELVVYEEQRTKLVKRFGEPGDDGMIRVTKRMVEFQAELNKLLAEKIKIRFQKIPLTDIKDINVKPMDMLFLEKFFED